MNAEPITYLRTGRQTRATGTIIEINHARRVYKVKPKRKEWGMIWIHAKEIEAGQEKPPIRPRENKTPAEKPKRIRKPKPKTRTIEQITADLAEAAIQQNFQAASEHFAAWANHRQEQLIP